LHFGKQGPVWKEEGRSVRASLLRRREQGPQGYFS